MKSVPIPRKTMGWQYNNTSARCQVRCCPIESGCADAEGKNPTKQTTHSILPAKLLSFQIQKALLLIICWMICLTITVGMVRSNEMDPLTRWYQHSHRVKCNYIAPQCWRTKFGECKRDLKVTSCWRQENPCRTSSKRSDRTDSSVQNIQGLQIPKKRHRIMQRIVNCRKNVEFGVLENPKVKWENVTLSCWKPESI